MNFHDESQILDGEKPENYCIISEKHDKQESKQVDLSAEGERERKRDINKPFCPER